ncbi:MAG: TIGR03621 family F420-dependent LLM class oxidoreductase [Acidimicrobiales bacterium]|nr:TIGR03621 family F420-dependent LLM class oxidoreductase [Acidimicrobiales bacterium]
MTTPFRFGVQAGGPADARGWAELARKAEDLGVSTLTVADHLDDQLAPVAAIMAAATATTTLRVGALVFCNDYRHPVVLAKEAATIDVLSEGRLEMGLGAGWMTTDYEQSGIRLDPPGARIDRLEEAVAVVKGLFGDGQVTHTGSHYRIDGLEGTPKPIQRPHPPLLIGGGGRRVLSLAAREADIVGINVNLAGGTIDAGVGPNATVDATDEKIGWIRDAAGNRFDDLELQVRVHVAAVTEDRHGLAAAMGPALGLSPDAALASPHALAGTEDEIVETLLERRERWGISYIGISAAELDDMAPVIARLTGT